MAIREYRDRRWRLTGEPDSDEAAEIDLRRREVLAEKLATKAARPSPQRHDPDSIRTVKMPTIARGSGGPRVIACRCYRRIVGDRGE